MWRSSGTTIEMTVGDYGIGLPIKISGVEFGQSDSVKLRISSARNLTEKLSVEFSDIADNTVELKLTEAQSELLPVGDYVYALDWYRDEVFMCNVIPQGAFRVVKKA